MGCECCHKDWTLAEAKIDFANTDLRQVRLHRNGAGWLVVLKHVKWNSEGFLVTDYDREIREFATADAAVQAIESIGYEVGQLAIHGYNEL